VASIAKAINRTPTQTYHLIATGALTGAVAKIGHRTIFASRRRLQNLLNNKMKPAPVK
jgi:hypothetical protein